MINVYFGITYDLGHNILEFYNILVHVSFITSKVKLDIQYSKSSCIVSLSVTEFNYVLSSLSRQWQDSISLSLILRFNIPIIDSNLVDIFTKGYFKFIIWSWCGYTHNLNELSSKIQGICSALSFHVNEAILELAINVIHSFIYFISSPRKVQVLI